MCSVVIMNSVYFQYPHRLININFTLKLGQQMVTHSNYLKNLKMPTLFKICTWHKHKSQVIVKCITFYTLFNVLIYGVKFEKAIRSASETYAWKRWNWNVRRAYTLCKCLSNYPKLVPRLFMKGLELKY